jgi:hypothetical protein
MISQFFVYGYTIPWRPYLSEALQQHAEDIGDTSQAKDYTNYAIILQQVHYWTDPYREYKSHEHRPEYARRPGDIPRYWIYRTFADWHRDIFSMNPSSLRRCFSRLRAWGFLLSVQPEDRNWQGLFWAVNHERLDALFADTNLPSLYKEGKRLPESVLKGIFEEVDSSWYDRPVSDRFDGIETDETEQSEEDPRALRAAPSARNARGGARVLSGDPRALRAEDTSILDHIIEGREHNHDHEDAGASVSDVNDVISSSTLDLSDEDKATNAAMLRDEHFGLNWSRTTAELAECYKPEQICAVLIRGSDNYRAGRIQNLAGWIIKVLQSPESDIIELWDEDTNHWIYKKHILKQEPIAPVREETPTPLANGNNGHEYNPASVNKAAPNQAQEWWAQILTELALQMPTSTYNTWVKDTIGLSYADGQFIIGVPNLYAREWLENRIKTMIGRAVSRKANRVVEVVFEIRRDA